MTEHIRNSNGDVRIDGEWVPEPETDNRDQYACCNNPMDDQELRLCALELSVNWSQADNVILRSGEDSIIAIARKFEHCLREG